MKASQINAIIQESKTLYIQRTGGLIVSNGTSWTVYDDHAAGEIITNVAAPELVPESEHSLVFNRRRNSSRWVLSRRRGPDLQIPLRRFNESAEAHRVLDLEDTGLVVREAIGRETLDLVVLHDTHTLRFADRQLFDVLRAIFPVASLAAEKEWHIAQQTPIVFHDYGDVVAIVESVVYTGTAARHIYPDAKVQVTA